MSDRVTTSLRMAKSDQPLMRAVNERIRHDRTFRAALVALVKDDHSSGFIPRRELEERLTTLEREVALLRGAVNPSS